jgi:hypothetical protein
MRLLKNVLGVAAVAALASACQRDDLQGPDNPGGLPGNLSHGLETSAPANGRIAVAVVVEGELTERLITLQGVLRFDPSRVTYAGQVVDGGTYVPVNESGLGEGRLRMMALKLPALERRSATFIFEVKAADYTRGLGFELEELSTSSGMEITRARSLPTRAVADLVVGEPRTMTGAAWLTALHELGYRAEGARVNVPGAGSTYGDINLTGTVSAADVTYLANVAVGNITLADPAVNRDGVIAGNVTPNNTADGITVGFGDPCRPGVVCSGPPFTTTGFGDITGNDVGQVAQEAVGINRPVVGEAIPGKGAPATNRVLIAQGIYTAADCTANPGLCNWTRGNIYQLDGVVQYDGGAVLNIESGTRIEGNTAINPNALYIRRNAQIFALGEATAPIVFTCTAAVKTKGCWGGVAIGGNAPVNLQDAAAPAAPDFARNPGGGGNTRLLEGPVNMDFGGNNAADNSGTMRYVRIEYAGFIVGQNNELNGLTLGGVGSGTTLEFLQSHAGLDDGYELFGGNVNVRHLVLTANSDDAFDWSFGWQGSAQFVIIQQDSIDAEKGLEGDNSEGTGATFNETPRTNGALYNFTLIGETNLGSPTLRAGAPAGNILNDAIHIRRGNWSQPTNFVVVSFPFALDLDDGATCTNAATDPTVRNSTLIANAALGNADGGDPACSTGATEDAVLNAAANANATVASVTGQLIRPFDVTSMDVRPVAGSTTATGAAAAPPAGNTFIQAVTYRGAVPPAAAITQNNISWYMGWTRGWANATTP